MNSHQSLQTAILKCPTLNRMKQFCSLQTLLWLVVMSCFRSQPACFNPGETVKSLLPDDRVWFDCLLLEPCVLAPVPHRQKFIRLARIQNLIITWAKWKHIPKPHSLIGMPIVYLFFIAMNNRNSENLIHLVRTENSAVTTNISLQQRHCCTQELKQGILISEIQTFSPLNESHLGCNTYAPMTCSKRLYFYSSRF